MDIKQVNNSVFNGRTNDTALKNGKDVNSDGASSSKNIDGSADRVTLTQNFSQITELEQKAKSAPADNAERIAAIKAAIADGSYQVNSQRVAEKLLQSEQFLSQL